MSEDGVEDLESDRFSTSATGAVEDESQSGRPGEPSVIVVGRVLALMDFGIGTFGFHPDVTAVPSHGLIPGRRSWEEPWAVRQRSGTTVSDASEHGAGGTGGRGEPSFSHLLRWPCSSWWSRLAEMDVLRSRSVIRDLSHDGERGRVLGQIAL